MSTVFLDCETLGLDRMAPIWDFAGVRIEDDGTESARAHFQIRHNPDGWLAEFEEDSPTFAADYQTRYNHDTAMPEWDAARRIAELVQGDPVIAGSNPGFDMERLTILLRRNRLEPGWHYHPLDVPTLAVGALFGAGCVPERPWRSDEISRLIGVDPGDYKRHTAMGDVEWTLGLYRAATDGRAVW